MLQFFFLIRENQIAIFKLKNKAIMEHKKEGELFFDIEANFWTWWKENVEFDPSDNLDLAFVWDKKDEYIFKNEFFKEKLEESIWDKNDIISILKSLNIEALLNDGIGHTLSIGKKPQLQLFTNINLQDNAYKTKILQCQQLEKESEAQRFLREQRQKEQIQRLNKNKE